MLGCRTCGGQVRSLLLKLGEPQRFFGSKGIRSRPLPHLPTGFSKHLGLQRHAPACRRLGCSTRQFEFAAALVFGIFRSQTCPSSSLRFGFGTGTQLFSLELQRKFTVTRGGSLLQRPFGFHPRLCSLHGGLLGGNFLCRSATRSFIVLLRPFRMLQRQLLGLRFGKRSPGGSINSRSAIRIQRRRFGGSLCFGFSTGLARHGGCNIRFAALLLGFALQCQCTHLVLGSSSRLLLCSRQRLRQFDRFPLGGNTQGGLLAPGPFGLFTLHGSHPRRIECFGMCTCCGYRFRINSSTGQSRAFCIIPGSRRFKLLFFKGFFLSLGNGITPRLRCSGFEQAAGTETLFRIGVFLRKSQTLARGISQLIEQPAQRSGYF